MRPGLVFVGLFVVLMVVYFSLQGSLGATGTFVLQAALLVVILAAAAWFRFARKHSGWLFFRVEDDREDTNGDPPDGESYDEGSGDDMRKAS